MAGEAVSADEVALRLSADTAQHDAALRKSADVYDQSMGRIRKSLSQSDSDQEDYSRRVVAKQLRLQQSIRATAAVAEGVSGRVANAQRNLGRQIADVGTGLAGGQSPFLILAQQAPQVADALSDTTGKVAVFARFLSGPLGAALLAAGSIAAIFAGKLFEGGEAADKQKDQLQRLTAALSEYQRTSADAVSNDYVRIRLLEVLAQRTAQQTIKIREQIKAQLGLAVANEEAYRNTPGATTAGSSYGDISSTRTAGLRQQLAQADKDVAEARRNASVKSFDRRQADQERNASGADSIAASAARVKNAQDRYAIALNNIANGVRNGTLSQGKADSLSLAARRRMEGVVNAPALQRQGASADRKADAAARQAEAQRIRAVNDDRAFSNARKQGSDALSKANDDLLEAQADLTTDTRLSDELQRRRIRQAQQQFAEDTAARNSDIDKQGPGGTKRFSASEVKQLQGLNNQAKAINDQVADQKVLAVNRRETIRADQEDLQLRTAALQDQRTVAQAQGALATSTRDRRDAALRLLDLDDQLERAQLEAVIASKASTDAEKRIAAGRLATLNSTSGDRRKATEKATAGPLGQYLESLPDTADQLNDALENVAANGLKSLTDGITDAITGAKSLGDIFGDVADQIVADLVRIAVEKAIVGPLESALSGGGGGGGLFGAIGSIFGRAGGGNVSAGTLYRVNEHRTEGYASFREPGKVVPLGNMKQGGSRIVAPQNYDLRGAYITEQVFAQMEARNRSFAAGVARDTVLQAAPAIVDAARGRTVTSLGTPSLPGGLG